MRFSYICIKNYWKSIQETNESGHPWRGGGHRARWGGTEWGQAFSIHAFLFCFDPRLVNVLSIFKELIIFH